MNNVYVIKVIVNEQALYLFKDEHLIKKYPISTSRFGVGNKTGSNKTPLGKHKIVRKIGNGAPLGTVFMGRRNKRQITKIFNRKPKVMQNVEVKS